MKVRQTAKTLLIILLLIAAGVGEMWAATYTYHIVNSSGVDIITATSTSGTLVAPDNIKSPWCDLTYWDAATARNQLESQLGHSVVSSLNAKDYFKSIEQKENEQLDSNSGDK